MSGPNIILDPKLMFQTLQKLQEQTDEVIIRLEMLSMALQEVATLTYAIGFGALVKKAEADINQVGSAVMAANNSLNSACKDVINQLVTKFAPDGAKSDYSVKPLKEFHIKVNVADKATIYPQAMDEILDEMVSIIIIYKEKYHELHQTYESTKSFWSGHSADQTRQAFNSRVMPKFMELQQVMFQIVANGAAWIEDAIKYEANLPTP